MAKRKLFYFQLKIINIEANTLPDRSHQAIHINGMNLFCDLIAGVNQRKHCGYSSTIPANLLNPLFCALMQHSDRSKSGSTELSMP